MVLGDLSMVTRRNNRKWLWWGMVILVLALIVVGVVVIIKNNTKDSDAPRNGQSQSGTRPTEEKEEKKSEESKEEPAAKKEEVKQYDGDDPNKAEDLTGVISYAGVSGSNLLVRVNIDQYVSTGNCKLTLTRDNTAIYNTVVAIESSVSTSTCDGFSIPVAELGSGKLTIEVVLESGGKYGKIVGETTI